MKGKGSNKSHSRTYLYRAHEYDEVLSREIAVLHDHVIKFRIRVCASKDKGKGKRRFV